ncbi:MAG TPA: prolipoprotein diacylglyceryl transferase family protein, partial [Candidatus Binatia bacterium]|nr:prolipoprotein diacylglyceryl transferase family protein [Candidatus Binatia bacterium]
MMALAFLISGYVVAVELGRKGFDPEDAWSIVLWAAVGGIVGARGLAILTDWQTFRLNPIGSLLSGSGFVWYGGLIGGFVSVSIFIVRRSIPWLAAVDTVAPALAIGQAIGRIGCQVSGDGDWGSPTRMPWGMQYPNAIVGWMAWVRDSGLAPDTRVHPAPVYETLAYCAIFSLLWSLRKKGLRDGSLLWIYFVTSSIARFAIEIVRVEPVLAAGLTQAQWIAIALFGLGAVLLLWRSPRVEASV